MKSFVNNYSKIVQALVDVCGYIAGALLFIPALSISYEVVMRGMFNQPTDWAIEISTYCVVIAGFLGMPHAYSAGKHINVDLLVQTFTDKTRCLLKVFTSAIGVVFCALLCTRGLDMALLSLELENRAPTTLQTPLWIPQMSLPIGFLLLTLQFAGTFMACIADLQDGVFDANGARKPVAGKEGAK